MPPRTSRDDISGPGSLDPEGPGPGASGTRWLLPLGAVAVLGTVGLAEFVRHANADALLPALMSTQRLTFYYWGQDRLANLVPLLTLPVRDVLGSFYVQAWVMAAGFFGLVLELAWFHLHLTRRRWSGTVLAASTITAGLAAVAVLRGATGYRFLIEQQYALTGALYLLGLRGVVADRTSRRTAGALLVVAATLVNPSWALLAPLGWLLRDEARDRWRRSVEAVAVGAGALVVSTLAAARFGQGEAQTSQYGSFSPARAVDGLSTVLRDLRLSVRADLLAVLLLLALGVLLLRRRSLPPRLLWAYLGAPLFAGLWTVFFAGNEWVASNGYGNRYFFPVYVVALLVVAGACAELSALVAERALDRHVRAAAAGTGVLAVGLVALGIWAARDLAVQPEPGSLALARPAAEVVLDHDVQIVVGNYWNVWPVVVLARDGGADALGLTIRSDPLLDDIRGVAADPGPGGLKVACIAVNEARCLGDLREVTGQRWEVVETLVDSPLAIRIRPR